MTSKPGDADAWSIASSSTVLLDKLAAGNFIQHFLDTINTARSVGMAPPDQLHALGLAPPQILLRWKIRSSDDGASPLLVDELRIGQRVSTGLENRFAQLGPTAQALASEPFVLQGSALKMLSYAESFNSVRRSTLINFALDEVDEVAFAGGPQVQRQGIDWLDAKGKVLPPARQEKIKSYLEAMFHLRVAHFVDDPAENTKVLAQIARVPSGSQKRLTFKHRTGEPTELKIVQLGGKFWATLSSRPNLAFELYPETGKLLKQWPTP